MCVVRVTCEYVTCSIRNVSYQHVFTCLDVCILTCQKLKKLKHTRLRHVTYLVCRVKHVCVYTCLTRVNTYSTYKSNKFQTKLKKYIRKIIVVLVTKNKIDMSYSEISYKLEWFWSLTLVSSQFFEHTSILKVWYAEVFFTYYTYVFVFNVLDVRV
jgi:hypothetical protein